MWKFRHDSFDDHEEKYEKQNWIWKISKKFALIICLQNESLYNLIWHPVKGFRGDKLARFRGIMGMFEDRKIIFNRYRNFTNMFEELTNFGVSGHDDCVDALVWLVTGLMKKGHLQLDF